jgi:cell division protein FtsW (lipid II flippase)
MPHRQVDPQHSLDYAIGAARLIGLVLLCFGFTIVLRGGYFNRYHLFRNFFFAIGLIVWVAPGALLIMCAHYLKRRRRFARRATQFIMLAQLFFAAIFLVGSCTLSPVSPLPIVLCLLWLICSIQLLRYLHDARPALVADAEYHRGFEPIAPQPVLPVDVAQEDSHRPVP